MPSISTIFRSAKEEFKVVSEVSSYILPILEAQVATYTIDFKKEIDRLESRVKDFESIRDNYLNDYGTPTQQLSLSEFLKDANDLIGIRVVVYTDTDVTNISNRLTQVFSDVKFEEKLTVRDIDRGARFGYRAAHINFEFEEAKLLENAPISSIGVEIQIRTLFSDAWARQSHKILYKGDSDPPDEVVREFTAAAAMLEIIDQKINYISNTTFDEIRRPVTLELERSQFFDQLNSKISGSISEEEARSFLFEFSTKGPPLTESEVAVKLLGLVEQAWQKYGDIAFEKYGIRDEILKIRVALFAFNEELFHWILPLHMHERVKIIKSNI